MKKYFAKYLPVEGEIKIGDKLRSESIGKGPVTVTEISKDGNIYWTDELDFADPMGESYFGIRKEKAVKLSPLMLCSRDIQAGDRPYTPDGHFHDEPVLSYEHEAKILIEKGWFKVIGVISSDAKWVKEGEEFDRNDLLVLEWGGSSIRVTIDHIRDKFREVGSEYPRIYVKCPCCGTFK